MKDVAREVGEADISALTRNINKGRRDAGLDALPEGRIRQMRHDAKVELDAPLTATTAGGDTAQDSEWRKRYLNEALNTQSVGKQ